MVTIKDIAREAGVSHGTVSNVLNKKGNVSSEKIRLVEETARKLGYSLNSQASILKKRASNVIAVIVPYSLKAKYGEFTEGLLFEMSDSNYELDITYFSDNAKLEEIINREITNLAQSIIIVGSNLKKVKIKHSLKKTRIYLFDCYGFSEKFMTNKNVSLYETASDTIVEAIRNEVRLEDYSRVLIICDEVEVESPLVLKLQSHLKNKIKFELFALQEKLEPASYFKISNNMTDNDLVIATNYDFIDKLNEISLYLKNIKLKNAITIGHTKVIHDDHLIYYEIDFLKYGRQIAYGIKYEDKLKYKEKYPITGTIVDINNNYPINDEVIKILIIESPMSRALNLIVPRFENLTETKVELTVKTYSEMQDYLFNTNNAVEEFDLIRIDMAWLQELGESLFLKLNREGQLKDVIQSQADLSSEFSMVNDSLYALPFDASVQMLFYRRDYFEDSYLQRQYFELFNEELSLPETFSQFDQISKFFTQSFNQYSPTIYGNSIIETSTDFIPRLRELQASNNWIDKIDLVNQAIQTYKQSTGYTSPTDENFWSGIANSFANGMTAMELLFTNYASEIFTKSQILDHTKIGYTIVPGSYPLLGGGSIGISRKTRKLPAVVEFIKWLYSENTALIINLLGGFLFNKNVISNSSVVKKYPWLHSIESSLAKASRLEFNNYKGSYQEELELRKLAKDGISNF